MKPFQLWRSRAQIERKRPAAENHLGRGEQAVALFSGAGARGMRRQIARGGKGGPGRPVLAVIPAAGVGQVDRRRIDRLDLCLVSAAEALNAQHVNPSHGTLEVRCG